MKINQSIIIRQFGIIDFDKDLLFQHRIKAAIIYKTIISNLRLNSIIDKIAIIRKIDPKELLEFINFFLLHECVRLVF